ncbi:ATP-dependent DNA helicase [Aphis craccivora]|uniref:ATP-dependent DNA helicase n=1 Tax=Aphis craccivora TaxID=307492 RepID=A0A6G0XWS1_APHCR|nr:ATP-dependent DNA helicase [Aphis craccivora]
MTYVRKFGRPDLFITFTCNPEWPELKNELFHKTKMVNGKNEVCHTATFFCGYKTKIQPDEIDKIISAEIPNKDRYPILYEIVCKNMIHGPCGKLNIRSPFMNNGKCSKKYPHKLVKDTQTGDTSYTTYRRRSPDDGGYTAILKVRGQTEIMVDNRWVLPYCPVLSRCFNAHINVEYCHSVKVIKYIRKYINKGSDRATFSVNRENDEITNYLNGRYICTSEAFWRIFNFEIHDRDPTVQHLAVHLENGQHVFFNANNLHQVIENPRKTTLTAFFELCSHDDFAKTLFYDEVPSYYTWDDSRGWLKRRRGKDVPGWPGIKMNTAIGIIYTIHPNQSECFHLRLLLNYVQVPTSFESLKAFDGVIYTTFKATCLALGLLENDEQWKNALAEATLSESPSKLRELFAIIIVFCQPSEPQSLWEQFRNDFCEDILHTERTRLNDLQFIYLYIYERAKSPIVQHNL